MLVPCLIYLVLLLACLPGCQALQGYRPVAIRVQDTETQQPISGAEVHISYPLTRSSFAPLDAVGTTGTDGIVHLQVAPFGDTGVQLDASAKGYLSEEKILSVEAVQKLEPAHFFEAVDHRPVSFVLEMYAEPRPTVEFILPAGFRGPFKAEIKVQDGVPCPPGQRLFRFEVPATGEVQVTGPRLLLRLLSADFQARYADGAPLSQHAKDSEVGLWWLRFDGKYHYFQVGTAAEYDLLRNSNDRASIRSSRSTGGSQGGRRGRRGGNRGSPQPGNAGQGEGSS
jgi:hypothetical protein